MSTSKRNRIPFLLLGAAGGMLHASNAFVTPPSFAPKTQPSSHHLPLSPLQDSISIIPGIEPFLLPDVATKFQFTTPPPLPLSELAPLPRPATTISDGTKQEYTNENVKINHRHSAKDWLHNVASLPKSTVLQEIKSPVLSITGWATLVSLVRMAASSSSSNALKAMASNMCMGAQVHSFLVSSLGLLLVFRTNSAYQRFTEGRRIWEQILSTSRNLTRLLVLYQNELGPSTTDRIRHLLASFPYLLRHHIRPGCIGCKNDIPFEHRLQLSESSVEFVETRHEGDKNCGGSTKSTMDLEELRREQDPAMDDMTPSSTRYPCWVDKRQFPWSLLPKKTLLQCANVQNRPLWICNRIAKEIVNIPLSLSWTSRERLTMVSLVDKLSNAIGECERIHQTAVPLNYARHSLRSLTLWLVTLPFALVKDFGLMTGPVCGITAWLMFGVYQIGHSIEDPFQNALRLSILCNNIRSDVLSETDSSHSAFELEDHTNCTCDGSVSSIEADNMSEISSILE